MRDFGGIGHKTIVKSQGGCVQIVTTKQQFREIALAGPNRCSQPTHSGPEKSVKEGLTQLFIVAHPPQHVVQEVVMDVDEKIKGDQKERKAQGTAIIKGHV